MPTDARNRPASVVAMKRRFMRTPSRHSLVSGYSNKDKTRNHHTSHRESDGAEGWPSWGRAFESREISICPGRPGPTPEQTASGRLAMKLRTDLEALVASWPHSKAKAGYGLPTSSPGRTPTTGPSPAGSASSVNLPRTDSRPSGSTLWSWRLRGIRTASASTESR